MLIVGTINSPQEEQLVTSIAKFFVVGQKFKDIGELARLQNIKKRKVKK